MWASASPVGLEGAPGCWQPGHHLQRPHGEVPTTLLPQVQMSSLVRASEGVAEPGTWEVHGAFIQWERPTQRP